MTQRVSVLVLGGRLMPNWLGILALRPNAVEFVVSSDTPGRYDEACQVLTQLADLNVACEPKLASAYSFVETRNACLAIAQAHPGAELIFDVTSAPKVMGFGAYEVARFLLQRAIVVDTANGRIINLTQPSDELVGIKVPLEQYLACYGRRPVRTFSFERLSVSQENAIAATRYLVEAGPPAVEVMSRLRSWNQGKGKRTIPFRKTQPILVEQLAVLRQLEVFGLISNLRQQDEGRVSYTLLNDADANYLNGTWLEVYVWDQARQCVDEEGAAFFDECDFSFEIPSDGARKEIDCGCMYRGQLIHCSCKTESSPFRTVYLDKLRAVSALIGGHFTSRLFVTNAFPPSEMERGAYGDYQRFLAQAKDRETVVVTGRELQRIAEILKREATRPTYPRI